MDSDRLQKLCRSAASERKLGNIEAAANIEARIIELECKSGGLVPVVKVDTHAAAEAAWSAMDQSMLVDVLCCVPGVARKVRRTMLMSQAMIELTQNGAWLVGRTDSLVYPPPMTTENTQALSTGKGTEICYL